MKLGVFVTEHRPESDTLQRVTADKLGYIFVGNGVYHATMKVNGKASPLLAKTANLYVLSDDLDMRGIDAGTVDKRVKVVSYGDIVDLMFNDFEQTAWI